MPGDLSSKVGHGVAKVLRLKVPAKEQHDPVTRGESTFSVGTYETYSYVEPEPTAAEWLREILPSWQEVGLYFYRLFPFLAWITRYNVQWLIGDLVAGMLPICTLFFDLARGALLTRNQVSPLVLSSFLKEWPMPSWPNFLLSTVSTLPLWESSFTGFSPPRKISLLV
jgi:hypothetical protein